MFGSSSPFGASTPSLFGGASPSSSPFGSTTSTAPFGMTAPNNPFAAKPFGSTFGSPQTGGMFGAGTSTGVFGATQAAPFGSTSPAFGTTTTTPSPFGATQPAFGANNATPVFGQKPAAPFGTSSFGAPPATSNPFNTASFGAFGTQQQQQQQSPAFGATAPAFGTATSTPAFGGAQFGSQPAGFSNPFAPTTSAFGTTTTPVFGQTTATPAFNASPAPFGSTTTTPAFSSGAFGQSSPSFGALKPGSRAVPYSPKTDMDGSVSYKLMCVSAMEAYKSKSPEELRWEDYQAGDKGGPAPQTSAGVFGQPSASNPFPSTPSALTFNPNPFQQKPQAAFPSFSSGTSTFVTSGSMFGASTPAIGSTPSFGFTAPSFSSTPTPSLFNSNTTPAFTTPSASAFGTATFGTSTGFGMQSSTSGGLFSTPQQQQPSPFATAPLFGTGSNAFGSFSQTKPATPTQSPPLFFPTGGATSQQPTYNFMPSQPQTGIFGAPTANMPPSTFGSQPMMAPVPQAPAPLSAPFGNLPAMPQMSIGRATGSSPSVQYGISTMPVADKPTQLRPNSLLTARHITPRSKIRSVNRRSTVKKDVQKVSFFSDGEEAPVTPKADVSFIPRENPRALFIHPVSHQPVTPVAVKRPCEVVVAEHDQETLVGDESGGPREAIPGFPAVEPEWTVPETMNGRAAEKTSAKPKQAEFREEPDRGNGYISLTGHRAGEAAIAYEHGADIEALMPKLKHSDYYTEPRVQELAAKERAEPGYCRRVKDFVVGRKGYGHIKFLGETDVRRLDIEGIIQFNKCEVLVYMDESKKPPLGQGLNKPAMVTLLNVKCVDKTTGQSFTEGPQVERFERKLKKKTLSQGAEFVSFDPVKGEWTFRVKHFSRYGLDDTETEDSEDDGQYLESGALVPAGEDFMEDDTAYDSDMVKSPGLSSVPDDDELMEDVRSKNHGTALPHSLPAQLRLNPLKMQQLKSSFFPVGEEGDEDVAINNQRTRVPASVVQFKPSLIEDTIATRSPPKGRPSKQIKLSPHSVWQRTPLRSPGHATPPLSSLPRPSRRIAAGFRLEESNKRVCANSDCAVDAALFMGTSFRVGWGPNGMLVHTGRSSNTGGALSSRVNFEKVALDRTGTVTAEHQYCAPLTLHKSFSKIVHTSNGLQLRNFVCNKGQLEKLCGDYEDLIVKQHDLPGTSMADQLLLKHQLMLWQLISVLFSEKDTSDEEEPSESMAEMKAHIANIHPATERLARRAHFSTWLQHSVFPLVQSDLDTLKDPNHLKEILILLTGKQIEPAVKKAVLEGDVRLGCLLSQLAGSVMNREDVAAQLEVWESDGLCDGLIEKDRVYLFKLLGGDIHGSLGDRRLDWKRFLGMLMWYMLPPEAELPDIIHEFQRLVCDGDAPVPKPMYLEEAYAEDHHVPATAVKSQAPPCDAAYYMMLLHASGSMDDSEVEKMLSSAASTFDPLDHRAAWHQKAALQAIGVLGPFNSYALDMSFVAQLLAAGLVQWAVYVVLHMPQRSDCPGLHEKVVKEILDQYCEVWSKSEDQLRFIQDELFVPRAWLSQAMATYCLYHGEHRTSVDHLLKSFNWQEAHVLFVTKVSASMFLDGEHVKLWELAKEMEAHKLEIENWDLGGGLYIDFYTLKWSFGDEHDEPDEPELDSSKMGCCKDIFVRIREAQKFWEFGSKLLRVTFSTMADQLASLLVSESKAKGSTLSEETDMFCIALEAPVPEDVQLYRLQGAVTSFANWITAQC